MTETSNYAFPKSIRLLNAKDYSEVFSGVDFKVSSQHFLFLARKQKYSHPRLGIIVAKKNVRFAVDRNKIKRQLRETYRLRASKLPTLDVVVLAKKGADKVDNTRLQNELDYLWRKLKQKAKS